MPGLTYDRARALTLRAIYNRLVDELVRAYRPGYKTVILLPGGMGSQLDRSIKKFSGGSSLPFLEFDPIWIDLGLIFDQDGLELGISQRGEDFRRHMLVPNGPLRFPFLKSYDDTEDYFRNRCGFNYGVFGWDWRRPLREAATNLEFVLKSFRRRVRHRFPDQEPLADTTLFAHSQGGLVAKVMLSTLFRGQDPSAAELDRWFGRLVTVGTPFYGTWEHQRRFYEGQDPLNSLYGTKPIVDIVNSLPGPYSLMFLDAAIYKEHFVDGPLAGELDRYPVRNMRNPGDSQPDGPAFWLNPYDRDNAKHFPPRFRRDLQTRALRELRLSVEPLPRRVLARLFHLRTGRKRTNTEIHWDPIDGTAFEVGVSKTPLSYRKGPGDGTVPYWSARLAWTPNDQVIDLKRAKDHGHLAEHEEVLQILHGLIAPELAPAKPRRTKPPRASRQRMLELVGDVQARRVADDDPRRSDGKLWRAFIEEGGLC